MTDKPDLLPCPADMLAMAEKLDFERQHLEDGFAFTATQRVMINAAAMLRAIARAPSREAELREALEPLTLPRVFHTWKDGAPNTEECLKAAMDEIGRLRKGIADALSGSAPVQPAEEA